MIVSDGSERMLEVVMLALRLKETRKIAKIYYLLIYFSLQLPTIVECWLSPLLRILKTIL
jgi:hypothetical protein